MIIGSQKLRTSLELEYLGKHTLAADQPRSQGLSSLAPWGGMMRDPGNEVGC